MLQKSKNKTARQLIQKDRRPIGSELPAGKSIYPRSRETDFRHLVEVISGSASSSCSQLPPDEAAFVKGDGDEFKSDAFDLVRCLRLLGYRVESVHPEQLQEVAFDSLTKLIIGAFVIGTRDFASSVPVSERTRWLSLLNPFDIKSMFRRKVYAENTTQRMQPAAKRAQAEKHAKELEILKDVLAQTKTEAERQPKSLLPKLNEALVRAKTEAEREQAKTEAERQLKKLLSKLKPVSETTLRRWLDEL